MSDPLSDADLAAIRAQAERAVTGLAPKDNESAQRRQVRKIALIQLRLLDEIDRLRAYRDRVEATLPTADDLYAVGQEHAAREAELAALRAELARWRAEPSDQQVEAVAQAIWDAYGIHPEPEESWANTKERAKTSPGWQDFIDDANRQARAAIAAFQRGVQGG